jgi:hypothetical protein
MPHIDSQIGIDLWKICTQSLQIRGNCKVVLSDLLNLLSRPFVRKVRGDTEELLPRPLHEGMKTSVGDICFRVTKIGRTPLRRRCIGARCLILALRYSE